MHGEKTIGFGYGNDETPAVLYIQVVTSYREFGEYNGIDMVLDSILLKNADDDEARIALEEIARESGAYF